MLLTKSGFKSYALTMHPICHPFRVGNILINLFCYYNITPFGVIEIADVA
jgi:hypothetical protein